MPKSLTQEDRLFIKLVEKLPVPVEDKTTWLEQIRRGEMNDELAEVIRQKITLSITDEDGGATRARYLGELTNQVRRWRLANQSQHFGRR